MAREDSGPAALIAAEWDNTAGPSGLFVEDAEPRLSGKSQNTIAHMAAHKALTCVLVCGPNRCCPCRLCTKRESLRTAATTVRQWSPVSASGCVLMSILSAKANPRGSGVTLRKSNARGKLCAAIHKIDHRTSSRAFVFGETHRNLKKTEVGLYCNTQAKWCVSTR